MKKKTTTSKLTIDKETVANLNFEQLSENQTVEIQGGVTPFTGMPISCCGDQYTSCV
ncbi:class I lanthipeptide [Dyadobacter aurulentus]|uniref:class I lanthipeptide n=1 Tax=Dyadobacter sp. UC 10 TaxID=2605428 RepID=UPI001788D92C|nr:class I lanthipeptide [Dyadobacter sp. UC 10]